MWSDEPPACDWTLGTSTDKTDGQGFCQGKLSASCNELVARHNIHVCAVCMSYQQDIITMSARLVQFAAFIDSQDTVVMMHSKQRLAFPILPPFLYT